MTRPRWRLWIGAVALAALACDTTAHPTVTDPDDPPDRDPIGPADYPPARQIRRLTAEQFHHSLITATGQSWAQFDRFAAAMGRPDLAEITSESRELSVTFDKLVGDAARDTCAAAVTADRAGGEAILRHASVSDRSGAAVVANVKYLLLRFLGTHVTADDDARLAPWLRLLTAPPSGDEPITDDEMALRWQAVCIGLVTHPDFLTY